MQRGVMQESATIFFFPFNYSIVRTRENINSLFLLFGSQFIFVAFFSSLFSAFFSNP